MYIAEMWKQKFVRLPRLQYMKLFFLADTASPVFVK